ncbi:hypothetical protein ZIOFF_018834 [Zingiber officinale]|uniref:Helicase-associated domain-containing protein n=1 Tax=Zingiber officinale TaxID=94328 RepID=A0A8J5H6T8_ZINOF|nr:hypothetical protein ZIOFF_018834 [Zingiber officinale]
MREGNLHCLRKKGCILRSSIPFGALEAWSNTKKRVDLGESNNNPTKERNIGEEGWIFKELDREWVQADQRAGRAGRTRPGKCYRLYPISVYNEEFLDATIPEIQRSSLAGTVLYLKSLSLSDIDILKFDFLDPPSRESLEDALRQLYLIDAIDENGQITDIGKSMAELPLEPSLARTLIEANELGCLSEALTVAAMLSAEVTIPPSRSKNKEKKRKQQFSKLPDGCGWGDHIQLLQVFESWDHAFYDPSWCTNYELQVRSMMFSKDVRNQLSQIVHKIAKDLQKQGNLEFLNFEFLGLMEVKDDEDAASDLAAIGGFFGVMGTVTMITPKRFARPLDVESGIMQNKSDKNYRKLRRALCKGYGNQLAERMIHHNGFHTLGYRSQLVQVHPSSVLEADEDGQLPDYVVYHELISTSRPFMRNVCAVEISWVQTILRKLEKMNIHKLSGGSDTLESHEIAKEGNLTLPVERANTDKKSDSTDSKIQAARERYLARKAKK